MEQIQKKKRKRVLNKLIGLGESFLTEEDALSALSNIESKIKSSMAQHIGSDNSTSPYNLFVYIFGISPNELSVYKRSYLWDLIKKTIRGLRRTNELYIVMRGNSLFVLKTREELSYVEKRFDQHIENISNLKKNARSWVKEEKWKSFLKD